MEINHSKHLEIWLMKKVIWWYQNNFSTCQGCFELQMYLFKILEYVITNKFWYEILYTEKLKAIKMNYIPFRKFIVHRVQDAYTLVKSERASKINDCL